jgi:dipeptidase E
MSGSIVAIGGGGFLMDDFRGLQERYLLSLLKPRPRPNDQRPKVLYLGTAGGDPERAQLRFMKLFLQLGCEPSTLPFFPYDMKRDYAQAVREADLVYVGGGNTVAMIAVWREFGFDGALREAWSAGTVFAGISAGANCWFQHYITDSIPGGGVRDGLGWLSGAFCPHLDSEPWRQPMLRQVPGLPVYGAPDGVMLQFSGDGAFVEAVTSREAQVAVQRQTPGDEPEPLLTRLLVAA